MRTDIPAFYSQWFLNRIREGYVLVRNPYCHQQVTEYSLSPEVVDAIGFCTKNPAPMLPHLDALEDYGQYWFVTITPYGTDMEPNVPPAQDVMESLMHLSRILGKNSVGWRYDPIIIDSHYTEEFHIDCFSKMCRKLEGYTETCVISFIDIFPKFQKLFPKALPVPFETQLSIGKSFIEIAARHGITVRPCAEGTFLSPFGADCSGCLTKATWEKALGTELNVPSDYQHQRPKECRCLFGSDIGSYSSCLHMCRYCYANGSPNMIRETSSQHDPSSPFLIGHRKSDDMIHRAKQVSWINGQNLLFSL